MTDETSLFGLSGKKALIIGGGQGMGEASAGFLARAGCDIALVDLVAERAENVASRLPTKAVTVIGDVLDDAQIPRIVAEAEQKLGGLDRMISIVGAATWGSLLETSAAVWDHQMQLNLRYFFLIAKEVANVMIRRGTGGRIVGIASVDGQRASPMRGAYGAVTHRATPRPPAPFRCGGRPGGGRCRRGTLPGRSGTRRSTSGPR